MTPSVESPLPRPPLRNTTYARTLRVLARHHFAVLTGPPEMGKTAIARMLGLALMTEGWEVHECTRPDELWHRFSAERPQLFVADDAFGSTEYRPEAAERWARELDSVLRAMDQRHWLVWTSRPAPFKAGLRRIHREHGVERFPQPAEVHVEASDLDVEEKAMILFRHARAGTLPPESIRLIQSEGWEIVCHAHFTPERIRRFVADRLPTLQAASSGLTRRQLSDAVQAEIREPTKAMASSLQALPAEYRSLLVALVDAPPGPVPERQLVASARRHAEGGLSRAPSELVDRLTDHFVRIIPPMSVTWVHPSWRDLVIDELAADEGARRRFLNHCSIDGLLLALSVGGGASGERNFPLLLEDEDWDIATGRLHELIPVLEETLLHRVLAALEAACEVPVDERTWSEVQALAESALERIRFRWDDAHAPVSTTLLGGWFAVASHLSEQLTAPNPTATWVELLPTSPPDVESGAELSRFDEWLRLAEILDDHAPATLGRLGFPEGQEQVITAVLDAAAATLERTTKPAADAALEQCLRRLARITPDVSYRAVKIATALKRHVEPFELEDVPSVSESQPPPERSIVERILIDLAPST